MAPTIPCNVGMKKMQIMKLAANISSPVKCKAQNVVKHVKLTTCHGRSAFQGEIINMTQTSKGEPLRALSNTNSPLWHMCLRFTTTDLDCVLTFTVI